MSAAILRLTYPPSTNRLWRSVNGRAIKSAEYRTWLELNALLLQAQDWRPPEEPKDKPVHGPYAMAIQVNRPDKRRRDLSNTIKAIEDCIVSAGFVDDDSLCQKLTCEWTTGAPFDVRVFIISTTER